MSSITSFLRKLREKGLAWCAHRGFEILASRSRAFKLKKLPRILNRNVKNSQSSLIYGKTIQRDVFYAFYDLQATPPSFDFCTFLITAEFHRKKIGCSKLHVVVVPGSHEGFKKSGSKEMNDQGTENMRWRLRNIVVACSWLLPSCQHVTVCTSRKEARAIRTSLVRHTYPKGYTTERIVKRSHALIKMTKALSKGASMPTFEATPLALYYIRKWIELNTGGRKVICITLRESSYKDLRNSNLAAWSQLAKGLDPSQYFPVFIRDTERAFDPIPSELEGLTFFPEPAWNLELRMALYELSYLNLLVNNGPIGLCMYNRKVRYLIFKMITPEYRSTTEDYFKTRVGISVGDQWLGTTPFQRFVWEDDNFEVIQREFKAMCENIEQSVCVVQNSAL